MSLDSSAIVHGDDAGATATTVVTSVHPATRWRVIGLACLGLLAGLFAVLLLLGVAVAILAIGVWNDSTVIRVIGLVVLVINTVGAFVLVHALRTEDASPGGLAVTRAQAPKLFRMIDDMRDRVDMRKLDRVILTDQMNATVAQTPKLFGLAGHRNDLSIGLPLLQALSSEECAAVVAHEIAHLGRADGKLNALVFRVRQIWSRLATAANAQAFPGCALLGVFAHWFRSVFDRASRDVLRANEFRADAVAASIIGPAGTARALARVAVAQAYLDELWSGFWLTNVHQSIPKPGPWARFGNELPRAGAWSGASGVLGCAVNAAASDLYSHPSLTERLDRLGVPVSDIRFDEAASLERNAARVLLGEFYGLAVEHFDQRWWSSNCVRWQTFYDRVGDQKVRLGALDDAALNDGLSIETAIERAARAEYLLGPEPAAERYMWCLARFPDEAAGYYSLGKLLLAHGDENGIRYLIHAMTLDETAIPDAATCIIAYLEGQCELRRARIYRRKAEVWSRGQTGAPCPLERLAVGGGLSAAVLGFEVRSRLDAALHEAGEVLSAWLVQTPLRPWSGSTRTHLVVSCHTGEPVAWSRRRWRGLCSVLSRVTDAKLVEMTSLSPEAQHAVRHVDGALIVSKTRSSDTTQQRVS